VSPVRYELGFIFQKTAFFIVTAVKTSNLTHAFIISDFSVQQVELSLHVAMETHGIVGN
jgi:cytochrome c biogenesis factor